MKHNKICILGAGFAGIGACERCDELGIDFTVYEKNSSAGGLGASFKKEGFTWDIGGHVIFSHYSRFDRFIEDALQGDYTLHERQSFINVGRRMIPYPFQNNIGSLPDELLLECLEGLVDIQNRELGKAQNFYEFIQHNFGAGIARIFMEPYNCKVWKQQLTEMSADWIEERISPISLKRILHNIIMKKQDISWGPNNRFLFPRNGGTGALFKKAASKYEKHIEYNAAVTSVSFKNSMIMVNGQEKEYQQLISTIPVTELILCSDAPENIKQAAQKLVITAGHMVGIGLQGTIKHERCWVYFPENTSPFYRVTYFSNYADSNVPEGMNSLLCETSFSDYMPFEGDCIQKTVDGLICEGILKECQRKDIVSTWCMRVPCSYPVPSIERNNVLKEIHMFLKAHNVLSRGRFGGFLYEFGNMDHSFMQGYEAVSCIAQNSPETVFNMT